MSTSTVETRVRLLAPHLKQAPLDQQPVPLEEVVAIAGIRSPRDETRINYVDMTPEEIAEEDALFLQKMEEEGMEASEMSARFGEPPKNPFRHPDYTPQKRVETIVRRFVPPRLHAVEAEGGLGPVLPCKNGLGAALWTAHSKHRPLVLAPTDLWLAIAQSASKHVQEHAEAYRHLFVKHEGRERLDAEVSPGDWTGAVQQLVDQIANRSRQDVNRILVADFESTTPTGRTASRIVLLDTMKNYYQYCVTAICGIPSVELVGPREDLTRLIHKTTELMDLLSPPGGIPSTAPEKTAQDSASVFRSYGEGVLQVLRHILRTFDEAEQDFGMYLKDWWSRVIVERRVREGCATYTFYDGWWLRFFLYGSEGGLLGNKASGPESLPSSISQVPFDLMGSPCQLLAGHFGIREREDGAIHPVIGWAVRDTPKE